MKLIFLLALTLSACMVVHCHPASSEAPGGEVSTQSPAEQRKQVEALVWRCLGTEGGVGGIVSGVADQLLQASNTVVDSVGKAATSIVGTVVGLTFAVLGIVIGLTLTVVGLTAGFMGILGMPLGIVGGLAPVLLGIGIQMVKVCFGLLGSLLQGVGK